MDSVAASIFPVTLPLPGSERVALSLAPAQVGDLPAILALFDDAVAWLAAKGLVSQWGTTPFSELPAMRTRLATWIDQGVLFVARAGDELVGTLVVTDQIPRYAQREWEQRPAVAYYVESFTTARRLAGQGIGRALLEWAARYAEGHGADYLRLDCYAGNADLCAYYRRAGFTACGEVALGAWRGQLFEQPLFEPHDPYEW